MDKDDIIHTRVRYFYHVTSVCSRFAVVVAILFFTCLGIHIKRSVVLWVQSGISAHVLHSKNSAVMQVSDKNRRILAHLNLCVYML